MGAGDAAGDEGAIFAQSLSGRTLSPTELSSLRSENDHGSVVLDGRKIGVEFHLGSDTPGGSVEGIGGNDSNVGGGAPSHTNGNSETDRNPPPKPKPPPAPVIPEPPAPIVQPSELLGPVSLPPAPVDDPITELNTFLQGTQPENLLGPVGGGTPTEENPPRTEDTNKPAPLAGSSTVPIAPPNPINSPGWFTRGIGLVGGFLRGALAGGMAVVSAPIATATAVIGLLIPSSAGHSSDMIVNNDAKGPRLDADSEQTVSHAVGDTVREDVTTNGTIIDSVPDGNAQQANDDFDEMDLDNETTHTGERGVVRTGTLPDGSRVTVRPSADGRPTIEITELDQNEKPIRGRVREIRYGSN